jgi:3-hydroxyacyl-CoA dehydrogenase
VNALSQPVRQALATGVRHGEAEPSIEAIVVCCEGRTFFAGADLAELEQGLRPPGLLEFVEACEESTKPVIAALHGTVFGGGVVVAYACDYRIAARGTRFAMPEVGLGLLPTFGGTQYLPRMVGVEAALQLIIDGAEWDTERALDAGLIDRVVPRDELLNAATAASGQGLLKRRARDGREHLRAPELQGQALALRRQFWNRTASDFKAPLMCLDVMEQGLQEPLADALVREHEAFLKLLSSAQSQRLRRLFFAERALRRGGFDRAAVEARLRAVGPQPAGLLLACRSLLREAAVPDPRVLDALLVAVFGLPRYQPSLIGELFEEPA